jgi:hypothetical protein
MIDTIVLTLSKDEFFIKEPNKFDPSANLVLNSNSHSSIKCVQNPTKNGLKNGSYKPRLTLTNCFNHTGNREPTLKIELSLPKLIFGNNFDELDHTDFAVVTEKLHSVLEKMGVETSLSTLKNSHVSAIHYSKNIPLTDGSLPCHYINKIKEADVKRSLDINQTDYRNGGHGYKWHSKAYEVAWYDKIRELEMAKKSDKRAMEKDNALQLDLLDVFQKRTIPLEVLRMEVRLKLPKIKDLFRILNIECTITFQNLFDPKISQMILLHFIEKIEQQRPTIIDQPMANPKALLAEMIINNPTLSTKQIFQQIGLMMTLKDVNVRELQAMLGKSGKKSLSRLLNEAKKIYLTKQRNPLEIIRKQLTDFVVLKLVDFPGLDLK